MTNGKAVAVRLDPEHWWRGAPDGTMMARLWRGSGDDPVFLPWMTPEEVRQACREFVDWHGGTVADGPAHAVLADHNLEVCFLARAIRDCVEALGTDRDRAGLETIDFLACLVALDDEERLGPEGET
jgi:hypothetical protein